MVDALQEKKYTIDFFCLSIQPTADVPSIQSGLENIVDNETSPYTSVNGYIREIWRPLKRDRPRISYAGQFRKFRKSDLPEIGATGQDASELELNEDQGLVERNFFVYYPRHSILAWCRNSHGSTPNQFAKFLSAVWGTKIEANPVLAPDAARRIMQHGITLKKVLLTIPRPTNPGLHPEHDFNAAAFSLISESAADSIHIEIGIDSRRADSQGSLSERWKRALTEAVGIGASTAKAIVIDDGIEHPIDLIADRVFSTQEIETNAKYPPSNTMYAAIDTARHECDELINDYFGTLESVLA